MPRKLHQYSDLLFVALYTLVGVLTTALNLQIPMLRVVFTLPLVLLLPGYALMATLFPRRLPRPTERLVMTLVLSIASTGIIGLLLNYSPHGLTTWAWLVALPGVIWGACLIAAMRRLLARSNHLTFHVPMLRRYATISLLMLCFMGVTIAVARRGEAAQPRPSFSALSVVRRASDTLTIGVLNAEQSATTYQLTFVLNGVEIKRIAPFVVESEDSTEILFPLPNGASGKLEILLSKAAAPERIYRSTIIWLP
jgi:hypothetical protein